MLDHDNGLLGNNPISLAALFCYHRKDETDMKQQINTYNFDRISSRMEKKFGAIEKNLEMKYTDILLPIESNLLRAKRKYGINSGRSVIEAIHICLLMIDGYLNEVEYDLDAYISESNKPYLTALLMSFDPFTNKLLMPVAEEKCDIHSKEGLRDYFEPPVKCLLRIEKSIELWTKTLGDNGYFNFLENQIGKIVVNNDQIDCVVVKLKEAKTITEANLTMQDLFPQMSLHEIFMDLFPTLKSIFALGYIPLPDEIHELTENEYASYERQGGDISEQLYTIIPKNYKYLGPTNVIGIMTQKDISKMTKAVLFLHLYAAENGCKSKKSEDILNFAAKRFPSLMMEGTKFERPPMKVLKPGEIPMTEREEMLDLMAHVMGDGAVLNAKITYKDADGNIEKVKNVSLPIEKQRRINDNETKRPT